MTREKKQKAIDALKISVPIKALTQEEFNDYIQTINKIMDYLEQEPILDKIRTEILEEIVSHSGTGEEVTQAYVDGLKKGLDIIDKDRS